MGWNVFLLIAVFSRAVPAFAGLAVFSQDINGARNTPQYTYTDGAGQKQTVGPFGWNFSYTRSFDGTNFIKHLEINFVFDANTNLTAAQQTAYKNAAVAGIESVWDNKFAIKDDTTGDLFPIIVEPTVAGPDFNQTVTVHAMKTNEFPGEDMTNWFVDTNGVTAAHEFGHMLGLFDEYLGGAVNQFPNPTITDTGLMGLGALNPNPVMFPRYYQQFLDFAQSFGVNPQNDVVELVSIVPEPISIVVFASMMPFGLLLIRKQHQQSLAA
jgi:hypothetical protein